HQGVGLVLIEAGNAFHRRPTVARLIVAGLTAATRAVACAVALQQTACGLGVAPQSSGVDRIKANMARGKIRAQQTPLRKPDLRQPVVVVGAEGGLRMAYQIN